MSRSALGHCPRRPLMRGQATRPSCSWAKSRLSSSGCSRSPYDIRGATVPGSPASRVSVTARPSTWYQPTAPLSRLRSADRSIRWLQAWWCRRRPRIVGSWRLVAERAHPIRPAVSRADGRRVANQIVSDHLRLAGARQHNARRHRLVARWVGSVTGSREDDSCGRECHGRQTRSSHQRNALGGCRTWPSLPPQRDPGGRWPRRRQPTGATANEGGR